MKSVRVLIGLLGTVLVLLGGVSAPAARGAGGPFAPPAVGTITGRVNPPAAAVGGRLLFQVDGVRFTPRLQANSFSLTGVPVGQRTVSVCDPGTGRGAHARVAVPAGGTANVGTLTLAPGGQLSGKVNRVTDPATGQMEALPGVEVVAEPEAGPPPMPLTAAQPLGRPRLVAVTDGTGAYVFRGMPPGGYRVSVVVPGLEAGVQWTWIRPGQSSSLDFLLREAIEPGVGKITGSVTSEDGAPIEGAAVTVLPSEAYYPPVVAEASVAGAAQSGAAATPLSLPRPDFTTVTDVEGRYQLEVPSGYLYLAAYAEGFVPTDRQLALEPGETLTVDLTLEADAPPPAGSLEGFVRDARTKLPLANAFVGVVFDILPAGGGTGAAPPPYPNFGVLTDGEGHYRLDGLFAGSVHVAASEADHAAQDAWVQITADRTTRQDFALTALPPPGNVEGVVLDAASRRPLAGVDVTLGIGFMAGPLPPGMILPGPIPPAFVTKTDAQGRYRFARVPDGQWQLRAGRSGYQPQTRTVSVGRGRTTRADFRLAPGRR